MTSSPTDTLSRETVDQTEANRAIAIDFLRQASAGHARDAMRKYAASRFVHHNPYFGRDADILAAAMDENARSNPDNVMEIMRTIVEGPLVAVHSRVQLTPSDAPLAIVHILRIEDGRIHEFWDVAQPVPAGSPNQAGMF
jgi:predicted SnoaL-like aldol condensation-catalyzing enzyme